MLLPLPEMKRYVKALRKTPGNTLNHTQLTDAVAKALGHQNIEEYKRHTKQQSKFRDTYQSMDLLSLYNIEQWKEAFNNELYRHGLNPVFDYSVFDKYMQAQMDGLSTLPALRISGLLYLLRHYAGRAIFDPENMSFNGQELLDYIGAQKLPEAVRLRLSEYAERNRLSESRYHEGVFSNLLGMWSQGGLPDKDFVEAVQVLIDEEISYLKKLTTKSLCDERSPQFSFPVASRKANQPSNMEFIQRVRNAVHLNAPLLMGFEKTKSASLFSNTVPKNLLLTNPQIKENILISGIAGSGRVRIGLGVVHQAIMAGSGCVYIDGAGDINVYTLIMSMAKSVGRQDDVVYQSIHHDSAFNPSEIRRHIASNKIVILGLPCAEKDPETMLTVYDRLTATLKAVFESLKKSQMSQYFPYLIVFCDMMSLIRRRDSETFLEVTKKANQSNLGVVQIDQDFLIAQEVLGHEKALFRHRFIMKQCEPMSIPSLGKFNEKKAEFSIYSRKAV